MAKRTRDQIREPRFDGTLAPSRGYGLPLVRTLSDEYRATAVRSATAVPSAETRA